jgi:hypothetical protein
MKKNSILLSLKRSSALVQALVIATATLLPAMLLTGQASGAQLQDRFIDLSGTQSSEGSGRDGGDAAGTDVTYSIGYEIATSGNIQAMVIDFCMDSPITNTACDDADLDGFDANLANLVITADTGTAGLGTFTIDGVSDDSTLVLTLGAPVAVTAGETVRFNLGSSGANDGITNPNVNGSFFARMFTYATTGAATPYTETAAGSFVDDGGVAMAIASELTITARVQEVLQFCVGSTYNGTNIPANDCNNITGVDINLGVVDSSTTVFTAGATDGKAMIRTNANSGAVIYYKAEQNTSSGSLKVAGATCSGSSTTDQCFNSIGGTQTAISPGVEAFGMTLTNLSTANGSVATTLVCDGAYDGDGSCGVGAPTGYAWLDNGTFDTIASSASVLDDVMVNLKFAATASPTTPTGLYTVTANFVATATF